MTNNIIEQAKELYACFNLEKIITLLKKNIDRILIQESFNTLYVKERERVASFKIFENMRKTTKSSVYFHIPFCRNRCSYCSYERVVQTSNINKMQYLDSIRREIGIKKLILGEYFRPDIFYVGGGTPTVLSLEDLKIFLNFVSENFDTSNRLEYTFETTPLAVIEPDGEEKMHLLKSKNVNRINVGVQSFDDEVTQKNGRFQKVDDIYQCIECIRKVGFEKCNIDLIYGLRTQNLSTWESDLKNVVEVIPDSITTFQLRLRSLTPLYKVFKKKPEEFPSEKDRIIMRIMALEYFEKNGYYEDNSDYFIRSEDKKYLYHPFQRNNINRNLFGLGASAYSLIGNNQVFNIKKTKEYIQMIHGGIDPIESVIVLNNQEYIRKIFADSLRTEFDPTLFSTEFCASIFETISDIIDSLKNWGLITSNENRIKLNKKGRVITDYISDYICYEP